MTKMTRTRNQDWRLCVGLAAAVAFSGATLAPATAMESWVINNSDCNARIAAAVDNFVSEREVRQLATHYLRELGFSRPHQTHATARVTGVEQVGEKWRVNFKYGGSLPTNSAVFFFDQHTGMIDGVALAFAADN